MRADFVKRLRCPDCGGMLDLRADRERGGDIEEGGLRCAACVREYPITGSIPRFVPASNYADSFGLQWNAFRRTQLDSHTGVPITRERFFASTAFPPAGLGGTWMLDVGCGAGRFAEVALSTGANVVAVDYSSAVDACHANLGENQRLHVVQADIYRLPFERRSFDYVYCLGVLQHTPDVHRAFAALPKEVKSGGLLAVDLYPAMLRNLLWSKYWVRPLTKRLPRNLLFRLVRLYVPLLLPVSTAIGFLPLGKKLRFVLPVANYHGVYALSRAQLREWAILDTFDMLAPEHDHPQTAGTLREWMREAGLREVEVFRAGHLIGRGRSA